jgi:hypothetical protein
MDVQRFIVAWLETLCLIGFGLSVLAAMIAGYNAAGGTGLVVGLIFGFLSSVVFFGAIFVLLEINRNIRALRQEVEQGGSLAKASLGGGAPRTQAAPADRA